MIPNAFTLLNINIDQGNSHDPVQNAHLGLSETFRVRKPDFFCQETALYGMK